MPIDSSALLHACQNRVESLRKNGGVVVLDAMKAGLIQQGRRQVGTEHRTAIPHRIRNRTCSSEIRVPQDAMVHVGASEDGILKIAER